MSIWLKKIEPITLHQSSEVPFIIKEDGILLCFSNLFSVNPENFHEFNISFQASPKQVKRQNTLYYKLNRFPNTVQLSEDVNVDKVIKCGEFQLPLSQDQCTDWKTIAIISDQYVNHMRETELRKFASELKEYNYSFVAHSKDIGPKVRFMTDYSIPMWHSNWYKTLTTVAHTVTNNKYRGYNWTKQAGLLDIKCFGFNPVENVERAKKAIMSIGIQDSAFVWV